MPAESEALRRVFIIHGRNKRAVEELSAFLRAVGLVPWPFEEVSGSLGGNPFIDQVVRAGIDGSVAVLALFTPDERAKLRYDYELPSDKRRDRERWQCRANVLYETGLALALTATTKKTLIVVAGPVDLPSDFDGRHLLRLANDADTRRRLRRHFVQLGCLSDEANAEFLDPAKHGNFDPAVVVGTAFADQAPISLDPNKIDLVLGPGGVRCIAFIGAIGELERRGFVVESICGVSAGSIVAAARAGGVSASRLAEMARRGEIFGDIDPPGTWGWFKLLQRPFAAKKPVEAELFRQLLGNDPTFQELSLAGAPPMQLGIAALDLSKGRLLAYTSESHPSMKVSEALACSTAVPLFYPAREIPPDRLVVDAAIQTHLPLWLPAALGRKTRNRVVALSAGRRKFQRPTNFGEYLGRLFEASVLANDHLEVLQSRRLVRIRIPVDQYGPLDRLNREQRSELIRQGEEAVEAAIQGGAFDATNRPAREPMPASSGEESDLHDRAEAIAARAAVQYARELQEFSSELGDD